MATYLITGGGRGIGEELARQAAGQGHAVFVTVRTAPMTVPTGVTVIAGVDMLRPETLARIGEVIGDRPVDVLVNNAGVIGPARQSTTDMDFDGFRATLEINTLAPLRIVQKVLPNLRAARATSGTAKVMTVTSRMGSMSYAKSDQIAYRASKAAVNKVMQGLATDLAREMIAVQLIHPGWVRTAMGGHGADIAVDVSARGILEQVDLMSMQRTGTFVDYSGATIDW